MAYAYLTLAQLKTELLNRLSDPGAVFWNDLPGLSEVQDVLTEALRTWNAFTNFYRARGTFQASTAGPFYDIPSKLQQPLRTYNVTDKMLLQSVCNALMEIPPIIDGSWAGTDQFTLADVLAAMQRRRNQFLLETRAILTRFTQAIPAPPIGRLTMPDTVLDFHRLAWRDLALNVTPVRRSDEVAFNAFSTNWNLKPAAVPREYSLIVAPPLTVQFAPPPVNNGILDVVGIVSGADLDGTGVLLGIPDDFAWVLKYGTLADLFGKEGQAKDAGRAQYCEMRWREGIELARLSASIRMDSLPAYCNGQQLDTETIENVDSFRPLWQNSSGTPTTIIPLGLNLVALNPVPDANIYSITVDVVQNAPIPVNPGDLVQIGREHLDGLLDYAQHIAVLKQGTQELLDTQGHYERLKRVAALANERLRNSSMFQDVPDEQARAKEPQRVADSVLSGG